MSIDLAQVGLEFATEGLKQGETAALGTFDRVEKGALKTQATVGATGKVFEQVAQQSIKAAQAGAQQARASQAATGWFEKEAAAIRAKSSVMLSETQVYQQVKAALELRVAAGQKLVAQEQREVAEVAAVIAANQAAASSAKAASGGIGEVGKAAAGTGTGLRTMGTSIANMAAQALGARAGIGGLVASVSTFAVGTLTSLGIIGGLSLLALGYQKLTEAARATEKKIQDVIDRLIKQREEAARTAKADLADTQSRATRIQAEINLARTRYEVLFKSTDLTGGIGTAREIARAQMISLTNELSALQPALLQGQANVGSQVRENREKEIQQLVTLIGLHKASAADLARRKQLIAEDTAELAKAGITLEERARLQAEINTLTVAGTKEAIAAQKAHNRELVAWIAHMNELAPKLEVAKDVAVALAVAQGRAQGNQIFARTGQIQSVPFTKDAAKLGFIPDPNAIGKALEAIDRIKAHAAERSREISNLFNDAFKDFFARGLKDWEAFFFSVQQLAGNAAQLIAKDIAFKMKEGLSVSSLERAGGKALAGAAAGLGVGLASGSAGLGLVGGAVGGFAAGGPLGAAVGAVSGFVSGLLSSAAKARAAAQQLHDARVAFESSLDDFAAIGHPRGVLGDALKRLNDYAKALQKEAAEAAALATGGGSFNPDLHGGRTQAQETALSAAELQKELDAMNKAIAAGGSGRGARDYVAALLEIRKAYEANIQAIKEQIALEEKRFGEDLAVRQLRAQGRNAEADAVAFANQQAREAADVQKAMGTAINQAVLDALALTQAMEAVAFAEQQAAAAAQKKFDDAQSVADIEARILENLGKDKDAAAARRAIAIAAELHAAQLLVDQGIITQQMFNDLAASFEVLAEATAAATAAAEAQAAFQKAQTARGIDAEIAGLTGDTAGAARINEEIRRASERNRVKGLFDEGVITGAQFDAWNAAFNQSLTQVTAATEALTRAGSGSDIGLTVARTITGVQADTMTSYLATISFNTSRLVELQSGAPVGSVGFRGALSATSQNFGGTTGPQQVTMHFGGGITIRAAPGETAGQAIDRWIDQKLGTNLSLRRDAAGITPSA